VIGLQIDTQITRLTKEYSADLFEEQLKTAIENQTYNKGKKVEGENKIKTQEGNEINPDDNIDTYYNYAAETVSIFYLPFISLVIWQFYEETSIAAKWSIKQKDFLFYFLFAVIIIPFQMIIDVLFYNLETYYHDKGYLESLIKWKQRKEYLHQSSKKEVEHIFGAGS
jgi:hypothetical protein